MMDSKMVQKFMQAGYSFIPVGSNKRPTIEWKEYQTRRPEFDEISGMQFHHAPGVALICGKVSGGIECIDFDLKNDPYGSIWYEFKKAAGKANLKSVLEKCVIQKTVNGGFHIFYKCPSPGRNLGLAYAIDDHGKKAKIIETRGEGGYVLVWPSDGYQIVWGDILDLPELTQAERDALIKVCESVNRVKEPEMGNKPVSKRKPQPVVDKTVEHIISQIEKEEIDITNDYDDWLNIGFALCHEYGEEGRVMYHRVSKFFQGYSQDEVDKKYDTMVERRDQFVANGKTIRTFYAIAHQYGLDTRDQNDAVEVLDEDGKKRLDDRVCEWVQKQGMKFNVLNFLLYTNDGETMTDQMFSKMWFDCRRDLRTNVRKDIFRAAMDNIDNYDRWNPVIECFDRLQFYHYEGDPVKEFMDAMTFKDPRMEKLMRCWLLGVVAAAYGDPQELILVLIGDQGVGKTEWFMRLLPPELNEMNMAIIDKLDKPGDSERLMVSKLIIVDDEWEGKSKKDVGHLKSMATKKVYSIREVYGKYHVDRKRLCMHAGCSNTPFVLNDTTGNRRVLPVEVVRRDFKATDAVDRNRLWAALTQEYFAGLEDQKHRLTSEDTAFLFEASDDFQLDNMVAQIIMEMYDRCSGDDPDAKMMPVARIHKEMVEQYPDVRVDPRQIGKEMVQMKFERWRKSDGRGYYVKRKSSDDKPF